MTASGNAAVVVSEHATRPFSACDRFSVAFIIDGLNQLIAESLLVAFSMVVLDI